MIMTGAQKELTPTRKRRIMFHILFGTAIIIVAFFSKKTAERLLFFSLIAGIALIMLSFRFRVPLIYEMLKRFETPQYIRKFPGKGALFFVIGSLLTLRLFSPPAALASLAILTFADPASHLVGVAFGKIPHARPFNKLKYVEGTLFGILVGFLAAAFFVPPLHAFFAAVVSMAVEALTVKLGADSVDDNLTVPLSAGTALHIARLFLPG